MKEKSNKSPGDNLSIAGSSVYSVHLGMEGSYNITECVLPPYNEATVNIS